MLSTDTRAPDFTTQLESSGKFHLSDHRGIERFGTLTGVPVLLNTSFNVKGEVIVDTPQQAIATFLNSGLDSLVMGRAIVDKIPAHESRPSAAGEQ